MNVMRRLSILLLCALLYTSREGMAHHSVLGFDGSRHVNLRGVVTEVVWANPHTYLTIDAEPGKAARWAIEAESPIVLQRLGWTRTSISAGDRISAVGAPARDGSRVMRCRSVTAVDGPRLPCFPEQP